MSAAAVRGVTHTLRTRVDGTLSITIEVEPNHAKTAFAMFGEPGTTVALAVLVGATQDEPPDYGHHYGALYRMGWWHNPRVIEAFGVDPTLPPEDRIKAIKQDIYTETSSESLRDIEPRWFRMLCEAKGIRDTLPAVFTG